MSNLFPVIGVIEWNRGSWMPNRTTGKGSHAAIDIYADRGAPIIAPVSGTVKATGSSSIGGNWIQIQGNDGYTYYFAHMDNPSPLSKGASVEGGQFIGDIGNSGSARSTATHVHFSMKKNGVAVSPIKFLEGAIVVPEVGAPGQAGKGKVVNVGDPVRGVTPGDAAINAQEMYDYDTTPSTAAQLAQYKDELLAQQPQESPQKQSASAILRGSLEGMSAMVKQYGFNTGEESVTGIPDDVAQISRTSDEEVTDDTAPR